MKTLLLFISFFIIAADAATVRLYFTDPLTNEKDTNAFYITPVGTNVLSNGGVVGRGVTTRYVPASDGYRTNTLAVGHYSVTNRSLGSGVVIRVPESSSLYDYTNLLISGYNIFVTVTNGSIGGTSGALTNNDTRSIGFSDDLTVQGTISAPLNPIIGYSFIGDGTGLTNLTSAIAADTVVSNGIVTGLAAGSYAVAESALTGNAQSLTNSLRSIFGTNTVLVRTNVANISTWDNRRTIVCSNSVNSLAWLVVTNVEIASIVLTNAAVGFANTKVISGSRTNGVDGAPGSITFRDVSVFSAAEAVVLKGSASSRVNITASDSDFHGGNMAFSTWYSDGTFNDCKFFCDQLPPAQEAVGPVSLSFESNDYSTNVFNSCLFQYGGSSTESVGFLPFAGSKSFLNGCNFISTTNASTFQSAIFIGEHFIEATFRNCVFNLYGGKLLIQYDAPAADGYVLFDNCIISPATNGVIVETYSATEYVPIYVRGGNLTPQNFDRPDKVIWLSDVKPYAQLVGQTSLTTTPNQVITNYSSAETLGAMAASASAGTITNTTAGLYKVSFVGLVNFSSAGDIYFRTNTVATHLKLIAPDATSTAFFYSMSGVLNLPANCRVDFFDTETANVYTSRILTVEKL